MLSEAPDWAGPNRGILAPSTSNPATPNTNQTLAVQFRDVVTPLKRELDRARILATGATRSSNSQSAPGHLLHRRSWSTTMSPNRLTLILIADCELWDPNPDIFF